MSLCAATKPDASIAGLSSLQDAFMHGLTSHLRKTPARWCNKVSRLCAPFAASMRC